MADLQGFWSYVHEDDRADGERISRLAKDVVEEFQMLTGEKISLFLDKVALAWGENWRDKIDSNLASVAFFIPVITPRYFMSPECRNELQFFARQASKLGIKELILPLLYVDFPPLHDENTKDELIKLICTFQWEDWLELRFLERDSAKYRQGVNRLAKRLVDANRQAEETTFAISVEDMKKTHEENSDNLPGVIDLLANSEKNLLEIPETLSLVAEDIYQIGDIMRKSIEDIERANAQKQGFGPRLSILQKTASELSEPTERIWSQSNLYASQLHDVDEGFRIIIERSSSEIEENPEAKKEFYKLFESIRKMSNASIDTIESLESMIDASEPLEKLSRDLRPVMRRLKQGVTILIESATMTKEWTGLIDSIEIIREDTTSQISVIEKE